MEPTQLSAADQMKEQVKTLVTWAKDQIGKHAGPIQDRQGETITDPDKFINSQLFIIDHAQYRSATFAAAYMRLTYLRDYLEPKEK